MKKTAISTVPIPTRTLPENRKRKNGMEQTIQQLAKLSNQPSRESFIPARLWGKPGNTRFSCHHEEYRLSGKRGEYLQKVSAKDGKSLSIRKQARKTLLKADILKAVSCRQGCTI